MRTTPRTRAATSSIRKARDLSFDIVVDSMVTPSPSESRTAR